MQKTMERQRTRQGELTWVDLAAIDLDAQTRFYEQLFGWTHIDIPTDKGPAYRMLLLDGARVAGASEMSADMRKRKMPSVWSTYIAVDDVDAMAKQVKKLHGKIVMPAMDVMQEGRMVGIQDPTGGTVFLWQARQHHGAEVFGEPGSIMWNDFNTRDPRKAAEFFTSLLGWEVVSSPESVTPYWQVSIAGKAQGGMMEMGDSFPADVLPHWLVYFGATDVRKLVKKAASLGASSMMEPMEIGGMTTFSVLSDPVGAIFAVMEPMRGM